MKKLIFAAMMGCVAAAFAADPKFPDIRPSDKDAPFPPAVLWQAQNDAALAAATTDEALAACVESRQAASVLLARLRGAYATDALVLTQIAAVSQYVMAPGRCAERRLWVDALIRMAEGACDEYISTFCLDQLRWCGCGCPGLVARIRMVGVNSGSKALCDFSAVVARELTGQAVGL